MGVAMTDQILSLRAEMLQAMKALKVDLETRKLDKKPTTVSKTNSEASHTVDVPNLSHSLIQTQISGRNMAVTLALLDTLQFEQMDFRHSKIHEAHPKTFEWVFTNEFSSWLESSEPLFWISGKPGSGKSTLMKYLVSSPDTSKKLRQWSENHVIASYFFWINGTAMQRSQEGLLRSLLYDVLRQRPGIIQTVLPERMELTAVLGREGGLNRKSWEHEELLQSFNRLSSLDLSDLNMCVFIDGLDEYQGEPDKLIDTIRDLRTMKVKMCIASRPWNVFEEAFGGDEDCRIYLQTLNAPDIRLYVNDKLRNRPELRSGYIDISIANTMVEEIVTKSQGVFLWVFLVVRSLIEGLRNRDRLSQLQKRLREFPSELDEFLRHIFQSLDPTYRPQIAHMFLVALATKYPLSALSYWFLDEMEDQPDLALSMPVYALDDDVLIARTEEIRIRLNGRCKGFLELTADEASDDPIPWVDFLHRTVKDFFMTTEIQQKFQEWQRKDFDACFSICEATLAEIKSMTDVTTMNVQADAPGTWSPVANFLYAAKEYEMKHKKPPTAYIDELEKIMVVPKTHSTNDAWSVWRNYSFLGLAIRNDLLEYLAFKLSQHSKVTVQEKLDILKLCFSQMQRPMSLEATCLMYSWGPSVTIGSDLQTSLVESLSNRSQEEIVTAMHRIFQNAVFEKQKGDAFASPKLTSFLANNVDDKSVQEILSTLSTDRKKNRNPLRKLFRPSR